MIDAIRKFFEQQIGAPSAAHGRSKERQVQIATAALLLEMVRMDERMLDIERQTVVDAMRRCLSISHADIGELLRLAEAEAKDATDYYQFTTLINQSFTPEQKEQVIEQLWRVAYADGNLHRYEEHLVRKLAELMYVPHSSFIAAKLRARDSIEPSPRS